MDSKTANRGKKEFEREGSERVMLEREKRQNRRKQGWPDAGKDTGLGGEQKVNTVVRQKWMPIKQLNTLERKQRLSKQGRSVSGKTGQPNS